MARAKRDLIMREGDIEKQDILKEPMTMALVIKGNAGDISSLKQYLARSNLTIIYKTISYGHLYITSEKP